MTRELLGRESGTVLKEPGGRVRVVLAYPNEYSIGMSSLGYQGVYAMLNARADVFCERVFLPSRENMEEHERTSTELFSLETQTPLSSFDVIAFSVSFENDYPNILRMLKLAKVPFRSSDRSDKYPLLALGGVCAFSNPEPLADFFDICFIGEAEEMLPEFMDIYTSGFKRDELLLKASKVEGIYVPGFYDIKYSDDGGIVSRKPMEGIRDIIKRRFIDDIAKEPLTPLITAPDAEFSSMLLVEAMRGCPWSCNFCLAGHVYNPPRYKPEEVLCAEIAPAAKVGQKVGLIAPSLSDYPHRDKVLATEGVSFSITSLRASPKSAEMVKILKGHKSISIAPEAGSQRLRDAINKKITKGSIIDTARMLFDNGLKNLRLYFMLGLPGETLEDVEAIPALVREIRAVSQLGKISLTLSIFVPKPFTPYQWQPMLDAKELNRRARVVKDGLRGVHGMQISTESPRMAHMQGFFAQGDRRLSFVLEKMVDGVSYNKAAKAVGLDPEWFIHRKKGLDEMLPWGFIDSGIEFGELWKTGNGK
jgi:radical SAM superfamily enzyme YgiQ (UPF0313 family)